MRFTARCGHIRYWRVLIVFFSMLHSDITSGVIARDMARNERVLSGEQGDRFAKEIIIGGEQVFFALLMDTPSVPSGRKYTFIYNRHYKFLLVTS